MPTAAELALLERVRAQERAAAEELRAAGARRGAAERERERLVASGAGAPEVEEHERRIAGLEEARAEAARRHEAALARIREARDRALAATPEAAIGTLDGGVPIALLPVRVETRFADGGATLHVRVFPDQVHVDVHEPELTDDEVDAGRAYWERRWPAADDREVARLAWETIATAMRPTRARWVVEATRPGNPLGAEPGPEHVDAPRRAAAWTRPARAAAMPVRWVAIGLRGGRELFRAWSGPVVDGLEVAPGPDDETAMAGETALGEGLRWLADARAARDAGVLLTVTDAELAGGARLRDGIEQLVVLGVDWTRTPDAAADEVARLLAAHLYGDGFSYVAQGTPTNNTAETPSGLTSDRAALLEALDPAHDEAPADGPDAPGRAGSRLAAALGLGAAAAPLAPAPGAGRAEHALASALLDATWEATAGTYLGQLLRPRGRRRPWVTDDEIDGLRAWAAGNVHAAGPLPVLRVGRQPYGLLPVVDSSRYAPRPGDRAAELVRTTIRRVRPFWERGAAAVPRLPGAADLEAALVALLQRSPVAAVARFRRVLPGAVSANLAGFEELSAQQGLHAWIAASIVQGRVANDPPRISELTTDPRSHGLRIPWARPPGLAPGAALPYVAGLRELLGSPGARDRLATRRDATTLLDALLSLSAALELDAAHGRVVKRFAEVRGERTPLAEAVRVEHADSSAIGIERPPDPAALAFATPKALAEAVVPDLTGPRSVAEHVRAELATLLTGPGTRPGLDGLRRLIDALDVLREAAGEEVDWALRGLLDLYAYRLDAWSTALATARLGELRERRPEGLYVGCYGWVEDLRPDPPGRDSLGYVHTPSIAHAVAAALLRSGHVAHRDGTSSALAIDLSAQRVRRALAVLEGVETGQPLGALLGYRLERSLRERGAALMRYVLPLRRLAPLRHTDAELTEPVESIAARDVVDAVALLERWREPGGRAGVLTAIGVTGPADRAGVSGAIDEVDDTLDAVADVLLAESVYQTVLGNQERARAALAALDRQERPVRPAVVDTPRSGTTVTHRVLVALAETTARGWERLTDPRGEAEPRLNAWIARLLGDPSALVFAAEVRRAGEVRATVSASAAELGLSPLGLVLAAARATEDRPTEIETRIAAVLAAKVTDPGEDDRLVLLGEPGSGLPAGAWGLAAVRSVAAWLQRLIGRRPASVRDLAPLLTDAPPGYDVEELAGRADGAVAALGDVAARLEAAASGPGAQVADALGRAAALGIVDALPGPAAEGGEDAARAQLASVRARVAAIERRLVEADAAFAARTEPPTPELEATHQLGRLRAVLGEGFPALPVFRLPEPAPLAASLADEAALLDGDVLAPLTWLHRIALVRPDVEPLSTLLAVAEANGRALGLPRLDVVQLPHEPGQRWVALRPPELMPAGRIGIVVHAPDGLDPAQPLAALVVDEWTETIPGTVETTALSFHYDAPAARPPQAIVLAVTGAPDAAHWSFDELLGVVRETIALARLRAVGPRELPDLGNYLPALYVPQDVTGDVPGVDLFELVDRARVAGVRPSVLGKG